MFLPVFHMIGLLIYYIDLYLVRLDWLYPSTSYAPPFSSTVLSLHHICMSAVLSCLACCCIGWLSGWRGGAIVPRSCSPPDRPDGDRCNPSFPDKGGGGCSPTYACLFWGGWGCHVNQRSTLRLRSKVILHKNRLLWPSLWHLNSHCKSLLCLVQSSIFLKLCIINEGEECALMIRPLSPLISDWYRFPVVNMACHNCLDLQLLN